MQENILSVIEANGYSAHGYGYRKIIGDCTHFITIFEDKIQMYAYLTEYPDTENDYDTGIVTVSDSQLQTLIDVLSK